MTVKESQSALPATTAIKLPGQEKSEVDVVITRLSSSKNYITYQAHAADDRQKASPLGYISLEVKKNCLWVHTMGNLTNDSITGLGKALIQSAKQECAYQKKADIRFMAIGDSHCFYHACGFVPFPTKKVDAKAAAVLAEVISETAHEGKKSKKKMSTSHLGSVKMGLKIPLLPNIKPSSG